MIFHFFQRPFANYFWPKWDMNLRFSAKSPQFIPFGQHLVRFCLSFIILLKNDFVSKWSADFPPQKRKNLRKITMSHILTFFERTVWATKNLVPFLKSWGNLLQDRWPNFFPHLSPVFLKFGQKSGKNQIFSTHYSPTLYINRKMIFHFFQRPSAIFFWPKWDMNMRFSAKSPQFIPLWPYLIRFWLSFVNSLKNDFITMWSANLPP